MYWKIIKYDVALETAYLIFELIQIALGKRKKLSNTPSIDQWVEVKQFACSHALAGIVFCAIEKMPKTQYPPKNVIMSLYGYAECYKQNYIQQRNVADKLSRLWSSVRVEAIILKGRSIAQYYPKPESRFSCDLDLFVETGWQTACDLLKQKGIGLEYEVYKEAEFEIDNVYVEFHRYITPIRGNKNLYNFELYLRELLSKEKEYFGDSLLVKPPLLFVLMLYIEHALGDFLKARLSFKHIVDWVVLRNQSFNQKEFEEDCKLFGFERFLQLLNRITDIVEGKHSYEQLGDNDKKIFDELIHQKVKSQKKSWFSRRVDLFLEIITNAKRFKEYGYCSMHSFLFNAVWAHFFHKEIVL